MLDLQNYYTETAIVNLMNGDSHRHMHPPSPCGQVFLHMQHTPSLQCQCYEQGKTELVYAAGYIPILNDNTFHW